VRLIKESYNRLLTDTFSDLFRPAAGVRLGAFTRNYRGATVYAVTLAAGYDENRYIP
jgi:hypothetical protein